MHVDFCIKAKHLFTGENVYPTEGCVLISKNKIFDIVPLNEGKNYIDENTEVIDAQDGLVMPGFIDAHTHFFNGALANSEHVCCEIEKSTSEEECAQMIAEYAKNHPNEKRIRGRGWFVTNWNDAPLPTKKSLDAVLPDIPVYLSAADSHSYWLNSKALEECGITTDTKVKTGYIGKLPDGELSGMLVEMDACIYADKKFREFSEDEQREIYLSFMERAASMGVTSLSEMIPGEYDQEHLDKYLIIKNLEKENLSKTRLHLFTKLYDTDSFDVALHWKEKLDGEYLKLSGLKGFIDGVAETYTGLLLEPYTDRPDTCGIGVPSCSEEELRECVAKANAAGLPVRIHCIADGSVRMALNAFEYALNKTGKVLPNTIEHIENIHKDDIKRFKELGVIPSMQPIHLLLDADGKIKRIGPERILLEWPTKTLLDSCGIVAMGTDYPVVDINPFDNIYAAVTRNYFDGHPASHNQWEKLTMGETLMGYTSYAARTYSRENEIGTLKKGMLADVIVLDKNLFEIEESEIRNTNVVITILGGKKIYERKS